MVAIRFAAGEMMIGALRVLIGGIFIYAGLTKIGAEPAFADSVASFHLLPSALNNPFALGLPPFEVVLGVVLIAGRWRRTAAFCALLVSAVFLVALTSAMLRGLPVDCGCFGPVTDARLPRHPLAFAIGRDVLLLAASATLYASFCNHSLRVVASRANASTESSGTNSR